MVLEGPYSPEYMEGKFLEVQLPLYGVLSSSRSRNSHLIYNLACLGIEKNGHLAYSLDTSKLVDSFTSAGAWASRKRQTRCEAGAQSLRVSYLELVEGGSRAVERRWRGNNAPPLWKRGRSG
jgi:hypothetical protein